MKLESTLRDRSGLLHLAPMLDTVMLLLIFVLIGGSFVLHSGVEVDVPISSSVFLPQPGAAVITVSPDMGEGSQVMFNGNIVSLAELDLELENNRAESRQVIIRGDNQATWGVCINIMSIAKKYGYEVAISTGSADAL